MPSRSARRGCSCAWRAVALTELLLISLPAVPASALARYGMPPQLRAKRRAHRVGTTCWDSSHWVGPPRKCQMALEAKTMSQFDLPRLPRGLPEEGKSYLPVRIIHIKID